MQELLDLFQRNWRQNEKQVFLCNNIEIEPDTGKTIKNEFVASVL